MAESDTVSPLPVVSVLTWVSLTEKGVETSILGAASAVAAVTEVDPVSPLRVHCGVVSPVGSAVGQDLGADDCASVVVEEDEPESPQAARETARHAADAATAADLILTVATLPIGREHVSRVRHVRDGRAAPISVSIHRQMTATT
ncbi:hypothetical protein GCM10027169_16700 [Gordonia jinhuaensis]|uniref:Uncharacterized protein n=1 Tax=Gordonia jinhuaensis TaxID=1517702 RepID=A0A916TJW6_9ACTN|nr:hypothetical protein GCM10011489_39080 [Gordonia jinhuaensis]